MDKINTNFFYWSMPRSGTTVLRLGINAVFQQYDGSPIEGGHDIPDTLSDNTNVFINIRDFRDVTASLWRIYHATYNDDGSVNNLPLIEHVIHCADTVKKRINDIYTFILKRNDLSKIHYIYYRSYYEDITKVINLIGKTLNIDIHNDLLTDAKNATDLSACKKISDELESFSNVDEDTDIHGKHIYKRHPQSWKEIIPENYHYHITEYFRPDLEKFFLPL